MISINSRRAGFSLIELLVVMGIISILMGLSIPALSRARRYSRAIKCRDQLRQVGVAALAYAGNRDPWLFPDGINSSAPPSAWPELLFHEPYPAVLVCPSGGSDTHQERLSYQFNYWLRFNRAALAKRKGVSPSRIVLVGESKPGIEAMYSDPLELSPSVLSMDVARHGPKLLSNYLWLDMHVSNEIPVSPVGSLNPWKPY